MTDEKPIDMGFLSFPADVQQEILEMAAKRPQMAPSHDGIYPRCVWCRGENYLPAVIAYSAGEIPCASTTNCGRYLPPDYITYTRKEEAE